MMATMMMMMMMRTTRRRRLEKGEEEKDKGRLGNNDAQHRLHRACNGCVDRLGRGDDDDDCDDVICDELRW